MRSFVFKKTDADLLPKLNPLQAAAIRTLHEGKLSYKEAAARLGVPLNTFKTRLHRGRSALETLRGEQVTANRRPKPADAATFGEADSC